MSEQSEGEEQEIIESLVDMAAQSIVHVVESMTVTLEWKGVCRSAGVQNEKQVHDRAIDEALDRLTNLRQGGVL